MFPSGPERIPASCATPTASEVSHASHASAGPAPLLVRHHAARPSARRPAALHAARREDRPVARCRGQARCGARPLLPSHRAALQGFRRGRQHRVRLSRLDLRPRRQVRPHSAADRGADSRRRVHDRLPLRGALRLCMGRAGGAAAAHSRVRGGRRSGFPAHLPVLRAVEHQSAAGDGELVRQLALQLRAQGQLRAVRAAQAVEVRDPPVGLGLRGRDHRADQQSAGRPSRHGHHGCR